jgi:hypothetical protein
MKIDDRVRVTTPPWAGQLGTIESINGAYHIVRLDSSEHEDDVQELYPNEFEKLPEEKDEDEDYCCGAGFHCPKCGGHHFGTDSQSESSANWTVFCHNEYGACGWSGPYRTHVNNDR